LRQPLQEIHLKAKVTNLKALMATTILESGKLHLRRR
jgi:hypothetical protein